MVKYVEGGENAATTLQLWYMLGWWAWDTTPWLDGLRTSILSVTIGIRQCLFLIDVHLVIRFTLISASYVIRVTLLINLSPIGVDFFTLGDLLISAFLMGVYNLIRVASLVIGVG